MRLLWWTGAGSWDLSSRRECKSWTLQNLLTLTDLILDVMDKLFLHTVLIQAPFHGILQLWPILQEGRSGADSDGRGGDV